MTISRTKLLASFMVFSTLSSYAKKNSEAEFETGLNTSYVSEDEMNNVATPKWEEKNGYVIMEAENTTSDLGLWITKTDVPGFTGDNHLEFTGNQNSGGQPKSPLQYTFKINTTGNYRIMLRGRRRITDGRGDHSNDCWIRIDGDFGVATKDVSSGELNNPNKSRMANLADLQTNAKFVAGDKDTWKWGPNMFRHDDFTRADGSTFHKERPVVPGYRLKAGEVYTLTISGRSKQFNLDRIIIGDYEKLTWTQFTTAENLEETLIEDTIPAPPVPTPPTVENSDVPYKGGNIIYFSDGNGGDIDDVGANALSLYTLSRAGLTDRVKLYVWADVFWYNGANEHKAVNQKTVNRAISNWGYSSDIFVAGDNYNSERNKIVNSIKGQINAATAAKPLYLVFAGAGGFTYTYEAFDEISDKNKLKNVVLVSHSLFNEVFVDAVIDQDGDGVRNGFPAYSWPDLEAAFSQPTYWSHQVVLDQNGAGNTAIDGFASNGIGRKNGVESPDRWIPWNWMGSFNNQTKFILDRMQETVVLSATRTEHGKADASDFGMIWYMLTGNKKGNPYEVQDYFQSGKLPKPFFITNVANDRRISANNPLVASDFQTERTTNGRLKPNTTRAATTVSGTANNLGAKWFKVPAPNGQNADDYLLVNALTGLSLRTLNNDNGAGLQVKNDYKVASNSVWFEKTSQLLTNRNSQKQIRKNEGNNNLSQVTLATDIAKWKFEEVSEGTTVPNPAIDVVSLESPVLEFDLSADYNVDVTYQASESRDIYVAFYDKDNKFIGNGMKTVTAGTGVVTINANNFSTAPVEGTGNIYRAFIRPVGTNFNQNIGNGDLVTGITFKAAPPETPDLTPEGDPFYIVNRKTGLKIRPQTDEENSAIVQVPYEWIGNYVRWEKIPTTDGYFYLRNVATGDFFRPELDEENSPMVQKPITFLFDFTQWKTVETQDGYFYLVNRATDDYIRPLDDNRDSSIMQVNTSFGWHYTQWTFESINSTGAKSIDKAVSEETEVYPNPTTGILNIKGNITTVIVQDMLGSVVVSLEGTEAIDQIDLTEFPVGIYFVVTSNQNGVFETTKIVKQ